MIRKRCGADGSADGVCCWMLDSMGVRMLVRMEGAKDLEGIHIPSYSLVNWVQMSYREFPNHLLIAILDVK